MAGYDSSASSPRFSIVMPAYNEAELIGEAVRRTLAQRYPNFELLVVDDGSSDETAALARKAAVGDARVRVLSKPNGGIASAYNFGVPQARGEFIVIAPVDDPLFPDHLEHMSRLIDEHPECDVFCSNGERRTAGQRVCPARNPETPAHEVLLPELIKVMFFAVGATYRKALFERVGGYRTDLFAEDWDFFLRAMKQAGARVWYTPALLAANTVRPRNKSADVEAMTRSDIEILERFARENELDGEERQALEAALQARHRRLETPANGDSTESVSVRGRLRRMAADTLIAVLGRERTERFVNGVKSAFRGGS